MSHGSKGTLGIVVALGSALLVRRRRRRRAVSTASVVAAGLIAAGCHTMVLTAMRPSVFGRDVAVDTECVEYDDLAELRADVPRRSRGGWRLAASGFNRVSFLGLAGIDGVVCYERAAVPGHVEEDLHGSKPAGASIPPPPGRAVAPDPRVPPEIPALAGRAPGLPAPVELAPAPWITPEAPAAPASPELAAMHMDTLITGAMSKLRSCTATFGVPAATVKAAFVVEPTGRMRSVKVTGASADLAKCLEWTLRRLLTVPFSGAEASFEKAIDLR
jgi:hypothetical protein